ncbi:MAG: hypothetical protein RRC07_07935 [Anaerolineae bacterium]|nr:hypothetical protein [Anaerolineae bacterium]
MIENAEGMDKFMEEWEQDVRALAQAHPYPPTPDIAAAVRQRLVGRSPVRRPARPAWQRPALVFAALLLALALALSVPAVRAAVREWLQIGAVRIVLTPPATEPAARATEAGESAVAPTAMATLPPSDFLTPAEARAQAGFELRLPSAAPAGRPPDGLYLHKLPGEPAANVVISVWDDPDRPGEPLLSLYQIEGPTCCMKGAWASGGTETTVGGEPAYWVEGPHPLQLGQGESWLLVPGAVLVWTDDTFTYRLESTLSLAETIRIAESVD